MQKRTYVTPEVGARVQKQMILEVLWPVNLGKRISAGSITDLILKMKTKQK